MGQAELHLLEVGQATVAAIRSPGGHRSREINRAPAPSSLNSGVPDTQILEVLGMGRTALWRARTACLSNMLAKSGAAKAVQSFNLR